MDTQINTIPEQNKTSESAQTAKAEPKGKLPSKPIVFGNRPVKKGKGSVSVSVDKSRKGSYLLKKLTGK